MKTLMGTKIRIARENSGISQDELATAVELSSEYISLLEIGKRRPSLKTLENLANYLKKDISYFFTEKEAAFKMLLQNERLAKETKKLLRKFQKHCEEYLYLEEVTGNRIKSAPIYTSISPERMAEEERRRIGLGNEPIKDIFSLVELGGLRLLRNSIPEESMISGIFIYLETKETAFALINSMLTHSQQVFIAAHEYCHFLRDRSKEPIIDNPDIFIDEYVSLYHPREQFAQRFAYNFLMPKSKVVEIVEKDIRLKHLRFENVIYLKRYFGVSTINMMQALKTLGYLSQAKYNEYQKINSVNFEETVFGEVVGEGRLPRRKRRQILSSRFKDLAIDAYRKRKINADKLSELINKDKSKILSLFRAEKS